MARHSSGQTNFSLSKSLTIALVAVLAIIALIVVWAVNRSDDTPQAAPAPTEQECVQGDLTLPIGGDAVAVQKAVEKFNASNPMTRDFCVTAESVSGSDPAATYLFAGTRDDAASALAQTPGVASGSPESWPQAGTVAAGVAVTGDAPADLDSVSFPVASNPTIAAAVALALVDGDEEAAAAALAEDADTTVEDATGSPAFATTESTELPDTHTFEAIDGAEIPVWAIATNAGESVSEDQARAGADFVQQISADVETSSTDAIESVLHQARALQDQVVIPDTGQPSDTLILIDTSTNMDRVVDGTQESFHTVTGKTVADLARETGSLGNQVALNNYSSPLNPGITRSWRPNVSFPDESGGENAAGAVVRFGTGGVPLTRSAAVAAAQIGSERAAASGQNVRVVIVTTGTVGNYDNDAFTADLAAAAGDKVSLHVVHVGHEEVDRELSSWAISNGGSAVTAASTPEVNEALRAAFGF